MSSTAEPGRRTADTIVAWILYVLQLALEAVLLLFAVFSVMMGDSCFSGVDDARICSGNYFTVIFYGYLAALFAVAIAVPVMIIAAISRDRRRWPWPFSGIVTLVLLTIGYIVLVLQ